MSSASDSVNKRVCFCCSPPQIPTSPGQQQFVGMTETMSSLQITENAVPPDCGSGVGEVVTSGVGGVSCIEENNQQQRLEPEFPQAKLAMLDEKISSPRWVVPVLPEQELECLLQASIDLCKKGRRPVRSTVSANRVGRWCSCGAFCLARN